VAPELSQPGLAGDSRAGWIVRQRARLAGELQCIEERRVGPRTAAVTVSEMVVDSSRT